MSSFLVGAEVLLAVVLLGAALGKARAEGAAAFTRTLRALGLRHPGLLRAATLAVPGAEGCAAVLLLVPAASGAGLVLTTLLMAALTTLVALVVRSGKEVPCACFGGRGRSLGALHLSRNTALTLAAAAGAVLHFSGAGPDGITAPAPASVVAAVAGACAGLVVTRLEDIADLFAPSSVSSAPAPVPAPAPRPVQNR
ncbi:MauE/DoxX family redox-associated membrane protein [Streptomyces sp. NBC_01465]|uniref:MauE/DoxX family redox-associated membrane protein n=1 Tax=Streptomyces sp. NBC_01465 TaxID=2903878 RepID=UPI002E31590E|nr:MauE/DoxX family redox-associated membrane protein [Streptomyces sp. NBC_01465]